MIDTSPLKSTFKGDIVTPSDADYEASIARWAGNAKRNAGVVAFVKDAEDVSATLKFVKEHNVPIAVKGGGHSSSGASSIEGGLIIDLSRHLNSVQVDVDNKQVIVGGGALWESVDKAAIEHGLATVAGTVNHTGVGGLSLGGGYGYLTGEHGMVVDNIVQVTMVVADGSIVVANKSQNADLFWAIKGGGSNFGVCIEFVFKLHPQRRTVFGGTLVFTPAFLKELFAAIEQWYNKGISEKECVTQILSSNHGGKPMLALVLFYNGSEAEGRENFKAFFDLNPVMDMTKEVPYDQMNAMLNPMVPHGRGYYMKAVHQVRPKLASLESAFKALLEATENTNVTGFILCEYLSLAKVMSRPFGETAFPRSPYDNIAVSTSWENLTSDNLELAQKVIREVTGIIMRAQPASLAEKDNIGYSNTDSEPTEGLSDVRAKALFGGNYPKLQQIKRKYDPDMVFRKWFPVAPA